MKKGQKKRINLFERSFEEVRETLQIASKRELQYEIDHFQDREWKNKEQMYCKSPLLHLDCPDHKMPSTRREFLGQGLIGTSLYVTLPTVLPSVANALTCPDPSANGAQRMPMIVIDAGGGASFAGDNVMVGQNAPDQFLSAGSYANFGMPTDQEPGVNDPISPFGAGAKMLFHPLSMPNATNGGGLGAGIMNSITPTAALNTDGITVACASNDDSGNNQLNISQALAKAGLNGELAGAIGTRTSASGGKSASIVAEAAYQSTQVTNQGQASALVNPGVLLTGLGGNNNNVSTVLRQVAALTEAQSNNVKASSLNQANRDVVSCGAQANMSILAGRDLSNIYADPIITSAFPNGPAGDDTDEAVATGAYLALTGQVGIATVEIGGCDYHVGGNRGRQNAKDAEIGRAIGSAITMAEAANSPIAIYLFSDGSTSSNNRVDSGMFSPQADNGNYASIHLFVYNPAGRPAVVRPQMGVYTANGVLQDGTVAWANNPAAAAQVIATNYLFLAGKIGNVGVLGNLPGEVNDLIAFGAEIIPSS